MKRILIIGATSSVAANVARLCARTGNKLYLLGRSEEKLTRLREELAGQVVGSQALDFNDCARNAPAIERAYSALGGIDIALIAHGLLGDQERSEHDFEEAELTITTNYTSVISQLIVLANLLEKQGRGCIGVITSVAGDRGRPRNYTYGSAKAAVTVYLQGLRSRLWPHVRVVAIKMGPVDTPMTAEHEKNLAFISSERAASEIVSALSEKRHEVYVPGFFRPIMMVVRALPQPLFQKLKFLSQR